MGLITQSTVSFVRKIFILAIIQSLFFSFGLYAMEEEKLPSFYSPSSSRALLLEEGEGESTSLSLPKEQMPIEEGATPFFHLHLGDYAKIVGYLESADQWQLALVCKNTLAKATLLAFRRYFISLPEEWRRDICQDKSEEAYKQFQKLSDEGALERLYVQTLLLQFQDKGGNYGLLRLALLKNEHFKKV